MEELGEREVQLLLILDLSMGWGQVVSIMTQSHFIPKVPMGYEAGWATELVWTQRLVEKSFCLYWGLNPDHLVIQSVVKTQYRLSYPS
jgi:hypothetical protein